MSSIPGCTSKLTPPYPPKPPNTRESHSTQTIINALSLEPHIEGGYFAEIDRNPLTMPNPFLAQNEGDGHKDGQGDRKGKRAEKVDGEGNEGGDRIRNASTSIYYMLTPVTPMGSFHRNKGRTIHTLIQGRGRYILIHADSPGSKKRIETFIVGKDLAAGERCVWVVEGEKYKASFLLAEEGLLISETVIPGFEYSDHDFLTLDKFKDIVTEEQAGELEWLVRRE